VLPESLPESLPDSDTEERSNCQRKDYKGVDSDNSPDNNTYNFNAKASFRRLMIRA
jgi:hypothetical protein